MSNLEEMCSWWTSTIRIGDYVIEYKNPYDDVVTMTIWKTHRSDELPFSEVIIPQVTLK